jgi:hypothetical protein
VVTRAKLLAVAALLELGHRVLFLDADVVVFSDPLKALNEGGGANGSQIMMMMMMMMMIVIVLVVVMMIMVIMMMMLVIIVMMVCGGSRRGERHSWAVGRRIRGYFSHEHEPCMCYMRSQSWWCVSVCKVRAYPPGRRATAGGRGMPRT